MVFWVNLSGSLAGFTLISKFILIELGCIMLGLALRDFTGYLIVSLLITRALPGFTVFYRCFFCCSLSEMTTARITTATTRTECSANESCPVSFCFRRVPLRRSLNRPFAFVHFSFPWRTFGKQEKKWKRK